MHSLSYRASLLLLLLTSSIFGSTSSTVAPTTTNNDDSCDISLAPAATLLLPYFQVQLTGSANTAQTTVFSVVNVSPYPQIARVTVWTDWGYPALMFNLFMSGYEAKSVDMREMLVRGHVPTEATPVGRFSYGNYASPYLYVPFTGDCGSRTPFPGTLLRDARSFLTTGFGVGAAATCSVADGEDAHVGSDHGPSIAAGYVTVDVVANCSSNLPTSPKYFTRDLLFDNVLIGDYQIIAPYGTGNGYAGGAPLVHIRAIPEGGRPGSIVATRLPYTFYDRLTNINENVPRTIDRRQPLPSAFAARWIDGGETNFETNYAVWREAVTGPQAACDDYSANANMPVAELIRFDERENAASVGRVAASNQKRGLSAASIIAPYAVQFPTLYTTDVGGWAYLNLNNGGDKSYSASREGFGSPRSVSQNWVVVNMFAEGRYGVSSDAQWLGNGCSPALPPTSGARARRIAASPNINP